ncbi:hypothetical protein AVEN_162208-1 [Araneus ventricosus]|uniref:Uncharacterized protein n=1 Tax=Araneus ventricosus TaxID=182803 RepID=A0A4Y2FH32_ARAVE|nr:hypothetical protein AVEN_162208-1 [Araneus ventricosus]
MVNTRTQRKMYDNVDLLALLAELKNGQEEMKAGLEKKIVAGQDEMKDQFRTGKERMEQEMKEGQEEMKNQIKGVHGDVEEVRRKIEGMEDKVQRKIENSSAFEISHFVSKVAKFVANVGG